MQPNIYKKTEHSIKREMIDRDAFFVVEMLKTAGYIAYIVGGSVRDLLLNYTPKDFDISTSARPEEVKRLFSRCILIGRRFRLAHVYFGKKLIEVATFRQGDVEDESLIVSDNIWGSEQEDVTRRDFTINGLFYDPIEEKIIDYVNGYEDAKKFLLRSIGNPFIRFKQDPVRMIRLIKFRARFGLNVDQESVDALFECRSEILKSSPARILEEILRMLESGSSHQFIKLLVHHNILDIILPNISTFLESSNGNNIYSYLQEVDQMILNKEKQIICRSILLAAFIFPIVQAHLRLRKPMHLGEIYQEIAEFVQEIFTPFLFIPKKLSSTIISIITTQYRFTPMHKKKKMPIRAPRIPEIHLSLDFFKLRTRIEPGLQMFYNNWEHLLNKKKTSS